MSGYHIPNRRAQDQLTIQYPHHFNIGPNGEYYRCWICRSRPEFSSITDAMSHEYDPEHVTELRDLDKPAAFAPTTPSHATPNNNPEPIRADSSVPAQSLPPSSSHIRDADIGMFNQLPGSDSGPVNSDHNFTPALDPNAQSKTSDDSSWYLNLIQWSRSREGYFAIPGPAQPTDPPGTIYDLCSSRAAPEEDPLSDEEEFEAELNNFLSQRGLEQGPEINTNHLPPSPPPPPEAGFSHPSDPNNGHTLNADPPLSDRLYQQDSEDKDYWPFKDKQEALLALITAFPRSVFSGKELDVVRWWGDKFHIRGLPSHSTVQTRLDKILKMLNLESRLVRSKLGNYFAINSLKAIIANEMANPLVREKMVFYPQDDGPSLKQAANGDRWKSEVSASLAAPMVRKQLAHSHYQDYFVYEPFLATLPGLPAMSTTPFAFIPVRYFERQGHLFARAHPLMPRENGYLIDKDSHVELPIESFLLPLPELRLKHADYGLPHPDTLLGIYSAQCPDKVYEWEHPIENPWRAKANGKEVRSVPLWLYCDDTSGNLSLKWNKHNSFLFTLAGLPREESQLPYNVQFLATSNIASPLEMLEEIAKELNDGMSDGIVAYDCQTKDDVLIVPWVYAVQGDNPMQSELCSHIGMTGKFFCRVCNVRGKDKDRPDGCESEIERIQEFMRVHSPRHASDTISSLATQESIALRGTFSSIDTEARKTGVKDKYLSAFLAILKERYDLQPAQRSKQDNLEFLREMREQLPTQLINPGLLIPELDLNQDTPVEILHVILLGVAKYFWRDAVSRQGQNGKDILKARIDSLDVSGLNLYTLRGTTLVQYARSLTGWDFRVILQIGPLVLHGLIPDKAYNAWIALSHVAPLAFQPEIQDISVYLPRLTTSINALLQATVQWSPQWFNKPKFHILLHLPEHICRFGPALLFATETFESYNFIIRLRSIHSNRHAPSHDIARAFSWLYAVRFLVSGGWILASDDSDPDPQIQARRQAGSAILALTKDLVFMQLMEMSHFSDEKIASSVKYTLIRPPTSFPWVDTVASRCLGAPAMGTTSVMACKSVSLRNGDTAQQNGFGLLLLHGRLCPIRILEILAPTQPGNPLGITAQILPFQLDPATIGHQSVLESNPEQPVNIYQMPRIVAQSPEHLDHPIFIQIEDLLCALSTFHNCARWNCTLERSKVIMQERQETSLRALVVHHRGNLDDILINVASLRSAQVIQQLREPLPLLDIQELATVSVKEWQVEEEKAQRVKEQKAEKKANNKAKKGVRKKRKADDLEESPAGPSESRDTT